MASNTSQPLTDDARSITCRPSAAVTGKRFVKISANGSNGLPAVAHATQNDDVFGVSAFDAGTTDNLSVLLPGSGPVAVTAGANLTAGQRVQPDGNGKAIVYVAPTIDVTAGTAQDVPTKVPTGRVLFDVTSGADAFIDLNV